LDEHGEPREIGGHGQAKVKGEKTEGLHDRPPDKGNISNALGGECRGKRHAEASMESKMGNNGISVRKKQQGASAEKKRGGRALHGGEGKEVGAPMTNPEGNQGGKNCKSTRK